MARKVAAEPYPFGPAAVRRLKLKKPDAVITMRSVQDPRYRQI